VDEPQGEFELIRYEAAGCIVDFTLDTSNETVWAIQAEMAILFGVQRPAIAKHLANIFAEGELVEKAVCSKMEHNC
jgi:hypothetical protein